MMEDRPYAIPETRYREDPHFKSLVDTLHAAICRSQFTPTEVREAALLACIHHDAHTIRHIYLHPEFFEMDSINKGE